MNTQKQRIAIAEACGWEVIKLTNHEEVDIDSRSTIYWSGFTGLPPEFRHHLNRVRVPDYLNDLNAMHEAEKVLIVRGQYHLFRWALRDVCEATLTDAGDVDNDLLVHATATHRAEAFLRTIGKWEDDK